jgi:L-ascorbate metabolism protein UlaG (beta-lactamase superfamily)
MNISVTHIDTACILLDINGYKILTDPTLDNAGKLYYHGSGTFSRKTENPAINIDELKGIDLVLLSHHQHKDNFDINGQRFALTVPLILSTRSASKAIKGITGLTNWESYNINTSKVPGLKITATPAQHHPWWVPGFLAGKVIGFIIEFDGQKNGVIYISGDTVYFKGIEEVAGRYKIDIGIFHLGSVEFRYLTAFGRYTMNSSDLFKSVEVLIPRKIIPIHYKGWTHFKEKEKTLRSRIRADKKVNDRIIFLTPGVKTIL